jgi:S-formylglutathione hydrolase FrmB
MHTSNIMPLAEPWTYPTFPTFPTFPTVSGDSQPAAPPAGKVQVELLPSAALDGNPLGDPAVRHTPVRLPVGYDGDPARRYPVIYWLHGFTGTAFSGLSWRPWEPSVPEMMDRAVAACGREAILVLVDGFTRYGGSQYVNSSFNGQYEDYVVHDVVDYVDAHYRTVASPEGRALAGKSSGGYGAMFLAMRHPEVFGALASVSGDCYFELCFKPDIPKALEQIRRHGGGMEGARRFLEAFLRAPKKSGEAIAALSSVFAMAMAYSPNPASVLGFDLPFDPYTGELRPDVWARWEVFDPAILARETAANIRKLWLVYFECGTRDDFCLQYGARILSQRLNSLGIAHEHVEFDDSHGGINYRYASVFQRVLESFPS